jgi:hypothetical protein
MMLTPAAMRARIALMLRWMLATLFALGLAACTELPPLPDAGNGGMGGGAGGSGGKGGTDGDAGVGGSGGTGGSGGGVDPCSVVLKEGSDIELDDRVQAGVAMGTVCANGCTTEDLLDRWSFTTAEDCAGKYRVALTWGNASSDLDVYLLDIGESVLDQATGPTVCGSVCEVEIAAALEGNTFYLVDVRAVDTGGAPQAYSFEVFPID